MHFNNFSLKQEKTLCWWLPKSPYKDYDAIICDGAVRSGKTLCMSMSFILWAMENFNGLKFGICGKTIASCRRNVITPLQELITSELGMSCHYSLTLGTMEVTGAKSSNLFYVFGGKDEGSAALIQGVTLAGVLLDEVALMPQSFVEQALARCSVTGSKFWFNCNPEGPMHWFYKDWVLKHKKKNALYLHFTMDDNPSLSPKVKQRYESLYQGVFRDRYICGKWVAAEGLIYPMFDRIVHTFTDEDAPSSGEWFVSIDYGILNPFSAGLWCLSGNVAYRRAEYYHDGRKKGQRTDEEHADAVVALAANKFIRYFVVDPSASSFIACLKRRGLPVAPANNEVIPGISNVASALKQGRMLIHKSCKDSIREMGLYRWDIKAKEDRPVKENDHAMDDIRYFARTILRKKIPAIDIAYRRPSM